MRHKKESVLARFCSERKRWSKSTPDPAFSHFLCFQSLIFFFLPYFFIFFYLAQNVKADVSHI